MFIYLEAESLISGSAFLLGFSTFRPLEAGQITSPLTKILQICRHCLQNWVGLRIDALRGTSRPLGVVGFGTEAETSESVTRYLPSPEQLKEQVDAVKQEFNQERKN